MLALAFTSAIVNGPLKLLIGRRRPSPRRRIRRMPRPSTAASTSIIIFTRLLSGITSVGLNATALVNETYT